MCPYSKPCLVVAALMLLGPLSGTSLGEDKHYVIFFASQTVPRIARFSHTFCTFIKAEEGAEYLAQPKFEAHTISWLPVSGRVRVLKLRADRGRNFTLHESLNIARATGQKVWSYGPYEIPAATYANLVRHKRRLDAGAYRYKAIDNFRAGAINCMHAVSLADPKWGGTSVPNQTYGTPSLRLLAEAVTNHRQILARNQDWILDKLAIRSAGINYMEYHPDKRQHLARAVPANPTAPVLARQPSTRPVRR